MHNHTGCLLMLGGGAVYTSSTKQRLNTNSSTEAELVCVNDAMAQILWTRKFLAAKRLDNSGSIIHQDNQSAMLLEKHGKSSRSKRTRHMDVRYYYINDYIAVKEVEVKYCPTGEMLADFFTKLHWPWQEYNQDHRSVLEKKDLSICSKKKNGRGPLKLLVKWELYCANSSFINWNLTHGRTSLFL